jgi:hypothetical protein
MFFTKFMLQISEAKMISWSKVDYIFAKALHRVDHPISSRDELQIENIDDSIEIVKEGSSSSETLDDDNQSTSFEVYDDYSLENFATNPV